MTEEMKLRWLATTGYAMEGVLAQEIRALGYGTEEIETSRVLFVGGPAAGVRANLWLRTAGHVRLVAARFDAGDFDTLFAMTRAVPWEDILPRDAAFPISCRLVNASIVSPSDTQAIVKKAIADRLGRHYGLARLPEDGPPLPIEVHIYKQRVTLSIDTSGEPLHKRGYRILNPEAALRESLAASLVLMAHWRPGLPFADPFCGAGTLCVEAAMLAKDMAPGLSRTFAGERWGLLPAPLWRAAREEARSRVRPAPAPVWGGDIDAKVLEMARTHARRAGVQDCVLLEKADARTFTAREPYGHLVCDPPYGKRLGSPREAAALTAALRPMMEGLPGWSCHFLTSDERFESHIGKRAHRRRVLFNGAIACRYYQYWGPRPPRANGEDDDEDV